MTHRRRISSAFGVATAIVIAFDVAAIALAVIGLDRPPPTEQVFIRASSYHGMRIHRPDLSAFDAMPCLQTPGADSVYHAALPVAGRASCRVATTHGSLPTGNPRRSLGRW
jgi:hypothetical protein